MQLHTIQYSILVETGLGGKRPKTLCGFNKLKIFRFAFNDSGTTFSLCTLHVMYKTGLD